MRPTDVGQGSGGDAPVALAASEAPLDRAVHAWLRELPGHLRAKFEGCWNQVGLLVDPTKLRVGTMYSGSDIVTHVLRALAVAMNVVLGVEFQFTHEFACECEGEVVTFLKQCFADLTLIFKDGADMGAEKAQLVDGELANVPAVDWLFAGFICVSRSACSSKRSANKGCVAAGKEPTGESLHNVIRFIEAKKPTLVTLENVIQLAETNDANESDSIYILDKLGEAGYSADVYKVCANNFGSACARARLFFVAFLRSESEGSMRAAHTTLKTVLSSISADPCEWPTHDPGLYLLDDLTRNNLMPPQIRAKHKKQKTDLKFLDEHCTMFKDRGLAWPPTAQFSLEGEFTQ